MRTDGHVLPWLLPLIGVGLVSFAGCNHNATMRSESTAMRTESRAGYTFVSVSTAEPGRLDELARVASAPSERMDGVVPGLLARQVGVDRERNTVVVWVTFDSRESLSDYLETEEGQQAHSGDMSSIATFEMYDLVPVSGRIPGLLE